MFLEVLLYFDGAPLVPPNVVSYFCYQKGNNAVKLYEERCCKLAEEF